MLKRLFTSKARVKLLTTFILNQDKEFYIRQLTRKLNEQINSIRRELDNLKKMGFLKSKSKNRRKFYSINKNFFLLNEIKNIIIKSLSSKDELIKGISKYGSWQLVVMSGIFVEKGAQIDLLLIGKVFDREGLEEYIEKEVQTKTPIKFSIIPKDDFLYRLKCNDKFIKDILEDQDNIIAVNKLQKALEKWSNIA